MRSFITKVFLIFVLFISKSAFACGPATQWLCEIGHGLTMAESQGKNAILISGYAYHTSIAAHWPTGVAEQTAADPMGLNEIPYGIGYGRAWYNTDTHEEYTLFAIAFADSYWKPEVHAGYMYQKFHPIFGDDDFEWGLGYSPMIFVKPSWTNDAPIIMPAIGFTSSIRYKNFELNGTWANVIFVNARFTFG